MSKTVIFLGLVAGAVSANLAFAQSAGVVQFATGDAKVVSAAGAERAARKGVPVSVGDTLLTAPGALAQLKMGDGAIVVVQPESRLTVAEFHYAGKEDGTEKVRYKLEQGGFRAITGAIGRTHKQNYLIETPIAHMGVRGTDHESYYFPATGPVAGDGAKPGAYNKVNTGRTYIRTGAGEVEVDPNQVGFVASAGDVPVILQGVPGFFNRSIAPRSARPSMNPASPAGTQVAKVEQSVETADGEKLVRPRGQRAPIGNAKGPLLGYAIDKGGAGFGRSANGLQVAASNGAAFTNVGADAAFGVSWGTWGGGTVDVGGEIVLAPALVHQIDSSMKTLPGKLGELAANNVTGTYTYAPGNGVVSNYQGTPGTIQKLEVGVDFGKQMISSYVLEAKVLGDWKASGSGSFAQYTGGSGIQLTGTCTGCAGTSGGVPTASGTAHGAFVGDSAQKMITSFGLTAAGQAISGAALLNRP